MIELESIDDILKRAIERTEGGLMICSFNICVHVQNSTNS